ncbi:MAG TPA: DMT family transporter [Candidatus Thiothrix moscowensis]|uniref:DMT family transporter n=1 Tax=unclassified Thiothrix TaxID=2636184 RepID=UPI0025F5B532|nr:MULTISPECIES: DMT family transporter [unclassified Thiothrix]HRJ51551.1 DMT family transporter [Candidatus Thiothrix moscowensis]HRJ91866.1 DMT family transporter [Candidatus Thiothrix moscowensis]
MREQHPDTARQRHFRTGLLLAVMGTALFALKSIFIKLAYAQGVDTVTLLTLRMLVAAPFYLLMLGWLLRQSATVKPFPKELATVMLLGFMGYYLSSWLDMQGLNYISAQLERLTLYTYPIMATLLGWFFLREAITRRILLALVLTYSGVMLLYGHEAQLGGENAALGVVLVMSAALIFAFYVIFSKALIGRLGSRLFTCVAMLTSTVFVCIHFLLTHRLTDLLVSPMAWGYVLLLGIFSTVLPSFMVSEAIGRIGAARTSIVGTSGPIITILLAVLVLGEPFGWFHLAGMVLVMTGVGMLGKP